MEVLFSALLGYFWFRASVVCYDLLVLQAGRLAARALLHGQDVLGQQPLPKMSPWQSLGFQHTSQAPGMCVCK